MGQIRSFIRFSAKSLVTGANSVPVFDANSNTAGGFHLLFDIFCLSIIIYAEVYGIIVPEKISEHRKHDTDIWQISLAYDISLNSRWKRRMELLPMAIQSIVYKEELIWKENKVTTKNVQNLATQLAEWFLQLLYEINGNTRMSSTGQRKSSDVLGISDQHIKTIKSCLSAFKGAEQYQEASMWGRLISAYCL